VQATFAPGARCSADAARFTGSEARERPDDDAALSGTLII
jgi:hypothetical protein